MSGPEQRDVLSLRARLRRRAASLAVRVRDRRATAQAGLAAPVRLGGEWRWPHPHPNHSRDELRARHLDRVVGALEAHGVRGFVVPARDGLAPQVGVLRSDHRAALDALRDALAGHAWYAAWGPGEERRTLRRAPYVEEDAHERLVGRGALPNADLVTLYPRYLAAGSSLVTGPELGVGLVVWDSDGTDHVAAVPNDQVDRLRAEDLTPGRARAHGRHWPSVGMLTTPAADDPVGLRWLIVVPPQARREHPAVVDLAVRASLRSVWFHSPVGTRIELLDLVLPAGCDGPDAPRLHRRDPAGDPVNELVDAWGQGGGPVVVLPAGGLLFGDLDPGRLVTPGGLGRFHADGTRLDERPPEVATPKFAASLVHRSWFEQRTGHRAPWTLSAIPQGLPPLDRVAPQELERLLADPDRPPATRSDVEVLLPVWWSWLHAGVVPGSLRTARLRAGSRRFVRAARELASGRSAVDAVSLDLDSLTGSPAAPRHVEALLAARLPVPAPWERGVSR